jgi:hypothetical protein
VESPLSERRYHVSPATNRESIRRFGLDWRRMPATVAGIALGHPGRPEQEGIFLTHGDDVGEALFFVRMGGGREIDVWEVDVAGLALEAGPDGWLLCRATIDPQRVKLVETWLTGTRPFDKGKRLFPPTE